MAVLIGGWVNVWVNVGGGWGGNSNDMVMPVVGGCGGGGSVGENGPTLRSRATWCSVVRCSAVWCAGELVENRAGAKPTQHSPGQEPNPRSTALARSQTHAAQPWPG